MKIRKILILLLITSQALTKILKNPLKKASNSTTPQKVSPPQHKNPTRSLETQIQPQNPTQIQTENATQSQNNLQTAALAHMYGSNPLQYAMYGNHPGLMANMMMNPYMMHSMNPMMNPMGAGMFNPQMMGYGLHPYMNPFMNPLMGGQGVYGPNNVYNSGEDED